MHNRPQTTTRSASRTGAGPFARAGAASLVLLGAALMVLPAARPALALTTTTEGAAPEIAPGTGSDTGDQVLMARFACDGGTGLDAVFVNTAGGSAFAVIGIDDRLVPMAVAISASGARYVSIPDLQADGADGDAAGAPGIRYQFWTKGDTARLSTLAGEGGAEVETAILTGCRVMR